MLRVNVFNDLFLGGLDSTEAVEVRCSLLLPRPAAPPRGVGVGGVRGVWWFGSSPPRSSIQFYRGL